MPFLIPASTFKWIKCQKLNYQTVEIHINIKQALLLIEELSGCIVINGNQNIMQTQ